MSDIYEIISATELSVDQPLEEGSEERDFTDVLVTYSVNEVEEPPYKLRASDPYVNPELRAAYVDWLDAGGAVTPWGGYTSEQIIHNISEESEARVNVGILLTGSIGENTFDSDAIRCNSETVSALTSLVANFNANRVPGNKVTYMTAAKKPLSFRNANEAEELLAIIQVYGQAVLNFSAEEQIKVGDGGAHDPNGWPDNNITV